MCALPGITDGLLEPPYDLTRKKTFDNILEYRSSQTLKPSMVVLF